MRTPSRSYAARRRPPILNPAAITAVTLFAVIGALWITGIFNPYRYFFGPKAPSTRGLVAVPVSAVTIPAYTRIVRDHLWNSQIGSFAVIYLRPDQVTSDMLLNMSTIIGRVVDHDKPARYAFTEADFLPKGTRPGLVAGIPAGKRAMRVPADRIPGLVGLLPGDRFDLISALPIQAGTAPMAATGVYGRQLDLQARLSNWQKQATVRVVVQNGNVVEPMQTRQVPVASQTLTSGLIVRTRPVQEVVIAVGPGEVARLAEAIAVGADISCVPRSGRLPADLDPVSPPLRRSQAADGTSSQPR